MARSAESDATAKPNQILVSGLVRSLVGEEAGIRFGAPLVVRFKGIPGTHEV